MTKKEITTLSTSIKYQNWWMTVKEDEILRPDGSTGIYGVVEKKDFAVIAAIDGDYIYMVEQFRYPVQERFWELPQGSWEDCDVEPEALARAELKEETGIIAKKMTHIGHYFAAYGFCSQGYHVFVATGLEESDNDLDFEEQGLISKKFKITEVQEMILSGKIKDATTIAVFGLMKMKGIVL